MDNLKGLVLKLDFLICCAFNVINVLWAVRLSLSATINITQKLYQTQPAGTSQVLGT